MKWLFSLLREVERIREERLILLDLEAVQRLRARGFEVIDAHSGLRARLPGE